ncbi:MULTISPECIES: hypothetical protein [unclassified Lysinibacillus]|uniref:hypothetical protein n=1 Tax=unclassified Lysinibacillus TaxID=2636778 RepID=UPI00382652E5
MKKIYTFISILTCFIFIFTFLPKTHAAETQDVETQDIEAQDVETKAATEHTAGVVTGYTGSTIGHGGTKYPNEQYNTVAIHQKSTNNHDPIFNFGTTILTKNALYVPGYGNKTIFKVTDTGDLDRKRDLYWFDVYFGLTNTTNTNNAKLFGVSNTNIAYTAY